MTELEVPSLLRGSWKHAVFVTYGANLPFFEGALLRELPDTCRNRVILADGRRFLDACAIDAGRSVVRHLNHRYIVEGIFIQGAAHAKLIFLANDTSGLLLVGSGNMGPQGYAGGGELFTRYEFSTDDPGQLNAFLAVREFIIALFDRGWALGSQAREHIDHLIGQVPWLSSAPVGDHWPVRSNLDKSYLTQIQETVAGRPVRELTAMAPFYDPDAHAIGRLIDALQPDRVRLLVQRGRTSVRPEGLQAIIERLGTRCEVLPIERRTSDGDQGPYLHAKLILLRLSDSVVSVQGSANLSVAALLRTPPDGNIEVVNLLEGGPDSLDDVLGAITLQEPVTHAASLDVQYDTEPETSRIDGQAWLLLGGEWNADRLTVGFSGRPPSLANAALRIGDIEFPIQEPLVEAATLQSHLSEEAQAALAYVGPVTITWSDDSGPQRSNPIYLCHVAALNAELAREIGAAHLDRLEDVDLSDAEVERLLAELDATLVVDRRSVWQVAGRHMPAILDGSDDAPLLDWDSVDLDALRRHPRLRQYFVTSAMGHPSSRMQTILDAISRHLDGLIARSRSSLLATVTIDLPIGNVDSEEEAEARSVEREVAIMATEKRIRLSLMHFVRRYLNGVRSPDFQRAVGPDVMAINYTIFMHLLCRLGTRRHLPQSDAAMAILDTWEILLTGHGSTSGYLHLLSEADQDRIGELLRVRHGDEITLVAMWFVSDWARHCPEHSLRIRARNAIRKILRDPRMAFQVRAVELAWIAARDWSPTSATYPGDVVKAVASLACMETRSSLMRWLAKRYGVNPDRVRFEPRKISGVDGRTHTIECLCVDTPGALETLDDAKTVLRTWMRVDRRPYYRICKPVSPGSVIEERAIYFDVEDAYGAYIRKDSNNMILASTTFRAIRPARIPWDEPLRRLAAAADALGELASSEIPDRF